MLKEQFTAASRSYPLPPAGNTPQLKDAGIFIHTFQPQPALANTFKKSQSEPNCVAFSRSHIFAAQAQKAVVHVYSRETGKQEAIVPFPERIRSLALVLTDTVLALGTDGGRSILWEVQTGRVLTTPVSHLQAVTCLVGDPSQNFLLTASPDAIVLVWSLLDLLSFASPVHSPHDQTKARHTLTAHGGGVTALTVGHSNASTNIACSASEDKTVIVWDYYEGVRLRTILLNDVPRCITLDPADRAAFVGFEDGSVQCIDFFDARATTSTIHDQDLTSTPFQPPASSRWNGPSGPSTESQSNATLTLSLSYDGTCLLSGHENGMINKWDVGGQRFAGTLAHHNGAPITDLDFEPVQGLQRADVWTVGTVIKPKPLEQFSKLRSQADPKYVFSAILERPSPVAGLKGREIAFDVADEFVCESNEDLNEWLSARYSSLIPASNGIAVNGNEEDFVALDNGHDPDAETQRLQQRLAVMEDSYSRLASEVSNARKESRALKQREREQLARRAKKENTRRRKTDRDWQAIARRQQAAVGIATQPIEEDASPQDDDMAENDFDESTSTTSVSDASKT
ncbi:MAG: hypothetical protein Q9162_006870 [Coniocarpon cinnabarinum]